METDGIEERAAAILDRCVNIADTANHAAFKARSHILAFDTFVDTKKIVLHDKPLIEIMEILENKCTNDYYLSSEVVRNFHASAMKTAIAGMDIMRQHGVDVIDGFPQVTKALQLVNGKRWKQPCNSYTYQQWCLTQYNPPLHSLLFWPQEGEAVDRLRTSKIGHGCYRSHRRYHTSNIALRNVPPRICGTCGFSTKAYREEISEEETARKEIRAQSWPSHHLLYCSHEG